MREPLFPMASRLTSRKWSVPAVCDLHESCSRHCFSCPGALCDHLAPSPPACSRQSLAPRRGHQTHNALVFTPASTVAARPPCVCVRVFLSRSSRRDSFRRCSLSTHPDSSRRGLLLLVDTHHRLISTSRRGLLPVGHFFVHSSRLVHRHVLFHLT